MKCDYCGTLYEEGRVKCSSCGAPYKEPAPEKSLIERAPLFVLPVGATSTEALFGMVEEVRLGPNGFIRTYAHPGDH